MRAWLLLLLMVAGARADDMPRELHRVSSGDITAHFGGDGAASDDASLKYAVTALWFTFGDDPHAYAFQAPGPPDFSTWEFDIFSPDGRYVLLLQERFGPYHVVKSDRLKDYLGKESEPDFVISGQELSPSNGGVHENARWTSDTAVDFSFSCCATEQVMHFDLERGELKLLREREATDMTKGPWRYPPPDQ
jgi:hypothetical protein